MFLNLDWTKNKVSQFALPLQPSLSFWRGFLCCAKSNRFRQSMEKFWKTERDWKLRCVGNCVFHIWSLYHGACFVPKSGQDRRIKGEIVLDLKYNIL